MGRVLNQLTLLLLALTALLALAYAIIFIDPQFALNPFKPLALAAVTPTVAPSPTPTSGPTRPPTWTPTLTPSPTDTPGPTDTPTVTPTPRATHTPVATRTPTHSPTPPGPTFAPFKFTKTNDPIVYMKDLYGTRCGDWTGVAGKVLDRDGEPLPGVSIVGWGGPIPEQQPQVYVSGSSLRHNTLYGSDAAYEIYIGAQGEFDFIIRVYENGQPVSDYIRLRTSNDCNSDLILLNIQRNH